MVVAATPVVFIVGTSAALGGVRSSPFPHRLHLSTADQLISCFVPSLTSSSPLHHLKSFPISSGDCCYPEGSKESCGVRRWKGEWGRRREIPNSEGSEKKPVFVGWLVGWLVGCTYKCPCPGSNELMLTCIPCYLQNSMNDKRFRDRILSETNAFNKHVKEKVWTPPSALLTIADLAPLVTARRNVIEDLVPFVTAERSW